MKKIPTSENGFTKPLLICSLFFLMISFCEASGKKSIHSLKDEVPTAKISEGYDSIDFGDTYVGQSQWPIYIYIENIGNEPLVLSAVHSNSPEFVMSEFSEPVTVAPSDSYGLFVGFSPNAVGNRTANIEITTNDPDHPVLVAYAHGIGFEPPIANTSVSGRSFPNQLTRKTFTVKNATPFAQHYSVFFYLVNGVNYEYSTELDLSAGETRELEIPINTNGLPPELYMGELSIDSESGLRFRISTEWLVLKPLEITSGGDLTSFTATILVGQEIPKGNFITIRNFNDITLNYTVTKKYPDLDFIEISPALGTLPNGPYTHLQFNYNAQGLPAGTYRQELKITIDDPELTVVSLDVTLHVVNSGPILSFYNYQSNRNFGEAWVGSGNGPICLYIYNIGTEPLIISKVISTHPAFSVFQADSTVLLPFDSLSENYFFPCIQFAPTSVGPISGEVIIFSNDPITPVRTIKFSGVGLPAPVVQTEILDTLLSNQKSVHTLTLQNKTSEAVEYEVSSYGDYFVEDFTTTVALAPRESKDFQIEFNAEGFPAERYYGSVYITSRGGYLLTRINLQLDVLSTINDFSLTYFKTNTVASSPLWELDVADPDIEKYTIRANVTDQKIRSVQFSIDDRVINVDNTPPYTINFWVLPVLSQGGHIISAQAFSKKNAHGEAYEIKQAYTNVINSAAVTQFDVVDKNGNMLKPLFDGDIINIAQPEFQGINIIARTNITTTSSVKFTLNGITARIDNRAPYGVRGTSNGYEIPWNIKPGSYSLSAKPYMHHFAWGPAGTSLTKSFTVINDPSALSNIAFGREPSGRSVELHHPEDLKKLTAYPNPVFDELHIGFSDSLEGNFELRILNTNGQIVYHLQGNTKTLQEQTISTKQLGLANGMYYVQLIGANGLFEVKKITKQ